MSGDVQPRKRKEKRRKKEDSEEIATNFSSDEQLHVHKDASTGGNICAKILFFLLSFMLLVMIGLVVVEYRGSADDEALVPVSKWAPAFDGWLEAPVKHGEHAEVTESGEQEHGESGEHEDESAEGEEHLSEEAASKEDDEEEAKESEEEETKSAEEEEEDQEEEEEDDNEVDKLEDEESEEVDENETEEVEDREEDEEDQEEDEGEGSEEYLYKHGKSEEDIDEDEGGADNGGEEEDEEAELGREEPDDDDDDEERDMSAYGHESDENDDLLREIPGITESDEDEEGDKGSDEVTDQRQKTADTHEQKIKAGSKEQADVPRRKQEKQVGAEIKSSEASKDKTVEEEEEDENEPEPEPSGDENLVIPDTVDAPQNAPQIEQQQIPKQIPQILVEPETPKDSEEDSYLSSEFITRRQTLLPDDLVHDLPQRELEESESSVASEEETDDGQEEFIFKQNVYKAENAFKAPHRDEKPFGEEKPYKQQSFEELMKKYHEMSPEGSDIESDEDDQEEEEEEDDERDLDEDDDELIDDEDELDNEEPEDEEEIAKNKVQGVKITTPPGTESTLSRKFIEDTKKEQKTAFSLGKQSEKHEEADQQPEEGQEEEDEEEDAGELDSEDDSLGETFKHYQLPKTRQSQRDQDDESGSEKDVPVTKSKIPKNIGGQNAQVYSKVDITNDDDWHIVQDLDRADDDAEEDINF